MLRKVELDRFSADVSPLEAARSARRVGGGEQAKLSMQTTLAIAVTLKGTALHSGHVVSMTLQPAGPGHGIVFRRTDLVRQGQPASVSDVAALYHHVSDTRLCTVVTNEAGVSVGTIEHLMAALSAYGVDNLLVEVDGPELPIMDGSASDFAAAIERVGLRSLPAPRRAIRILKPVIVQEEGGKQVSLQPGKGFHLSFDIEFAERAIGRQMVEADLHDVEFVSDFLPARTFGRLQDVEAMRSAGLALGGSLDNSVIVDGERVLNPGGLRFEDECVRHKLIDAVGDLALAGAPLIGHYEGVRAGHALNNRLLHALFADASAWEWATLDARDVPPASVRPLSFAIPAE